MRRYIGIIDERLNERGIERTENTYSFIKGITQNKTPKELGFGDKERGPIGFAVIPISIESNSASRIDGGKK